MGQRGPAAARTAKHKAQSKLTQFLDQGNKCKVLLLNLKDKRSGAMQRPKVSTREECQVNLLTLPVCHRPCLAW